MYNAHYDYDFGIFDGLFAGLSVGLAILVLAVGVCFIVAYFMAISSLVKTAHAKGCPFSNGKLWFIGLFTTPIILGLLVAAQPDRSLKE